MVNCKLAVFGFGYFGYRRRFDSSISQCRSSANDSEDPFWIRSEGVITIASILNGLAALPAILGYVEAFASAVALWYVQRQNNATQAMIADAAALGARAQTEADRYAVAQAWQTALGRPRASVS